MTDDWEPDESCYDVLKLSRIKKEFAKKQLAEFRIFLDRFKRNNDLLELEIYPTCKV